MPRPAGDGQLGTMTDEKRGVAGVTVVGAGSAPAPADQVSILLGVEVVRAAPGEAFTAAAETTTRVLAILADNGVDARSVRSRDLTLGPRSEYRNDREVLVGYAAGQWLEVLRQGLDGIERLLTDVATLGGEGVRIDGVTLNAGHPEEAMTAAREAAFAAATTAAEHFAAMAGRTLGQVEWIDERPSMGRPHPMMGGDHLASAMAMPVATGDTEVHAEVTVHWVFD